jgi:hypothetical protein
MIDPGFQAEAAKEHLEIDEVSGQRLEEILRNAFSLPADVVEEANAAMNLTGSTSSE